MRGGKNEVLFMEIVDDILKINRERPRKRTESIETPEPWKMFKGILDCTDYACRRYDVKSIKDLSKEQYSHACAEYITALIEYTTEFFEFVKSHE